MLELLGTSSGAYRADPLFIAAPTDWRMQGEDAAIPTCADIGETSDGRRIWRVSGSVRVVSPEGDQYRLLAGQDSEARDTLLLTGPLARGVVSRDGRPVYLGAPRAEVKDRGQPRAANPGELWWRQAASRSEVKFVPAKRLEQQGIIRVRGGWRYLYRAIDRDGALVDVMMSEHRDLAAAKAFFRSVKAVTGIKHPIGSPLTVTTPTLGRSGSSSANGCGTERAAT